MLDYQLRVKAEKDDLDGRIDRLGAFFSTAAFHNLPTEDRDLMTAQFLVMKELSKVLGKRIARFSMPPLLIGLHGKARSGKDTVARMLAKLEPTFRITSFAGPLKDAAAVMFDINTANGWHLTDEAKETHDKVWGMTYRDIFQKLGTEAIRGTFGEDFWVKRWKIEFDRNRAPTIVTDVRFENEADMIRSLGGTVLHIERPQAGLQGSQAKHASEAGVKRDSMRDYIIYNSGTLDNLELSVSEFWAGLGVKK